MSIAKQTLEAFVASERARLEAFEREWRIGMVQKPEYFPAELEVGTWDEAYQTFDESVSMVDAAPDQPGR